MRENNNLYKLTLILIMIIFFMVPNDIVWGGNPFQTVPTIGPTPTRTRTEIPSTTQPARTPTTVSSTATSTLVTIPSATSMVGITVESTYTPHSIENTSSVSLSPSETSEIFPTNEQTSANDISTVKETGEESTQEEQSVQEEDSSIPAFVFPIVVVLLLVIIYLIIRLSIKKSNDATPTKK